MYLHRWIGIIAMTTGALISCTLVNPDSAVPDKEERRIEVIDFSEDLATYGTDWVYGRVNSVKIPDIDEVEMIVFEASVRSQSDDEFCEVQLFNYEDERTVPYSLVRSQVRYLIHAVRTPDLRGYLPSHEFPVGFRFRSTRENYFAGITKARLIIYYK